MLLTLPRLRGQLGMLALVSLAAVGCGACRATTPQPRDAGFDGGQDAGSDSGQDAQIDDAALDSAVGDAGPDPLWTAVPGSADACVIEYARDPTAAYTPQWVACPAGAAPGCERLAGQGGPIGERFVDGELRVFVLTGSATQYVNVLTSHDAALQALRGPPPSDPCHLGFAGVGGGRAVFSTSTATDANHYDERQYVLAENASVWPPPAVVANRVNANLADIFLVSATTYGARIEPAAEIEVYEGTRSSVLRGVGIGGSPEVMFLLGRDFFWEAWGAGYVARIFQGTVDGASLFYETPDGSDLKGFGTDGIDMAWTQGYGPHPDGVTFDRYELWTAPYTTDPAALAPRLVGPIAYEGMGVVGNGWYVHGTVGSDALTLVRLSDGARKQLPPSGDGFIGDRRPIIGGGHIAAEASRRSPTGFERTLLVTPIDTLPDLP